MLKFVVMKEFADSIEWIESGLKKLTVDDYFLLRSREVVRNEMNNNTRKNIDRITNEDRNLLKRLADG